jgi:hypothetical protein
LEEQARCEVDDLAVGFWFFGGLRDEFKTGDPFLL